MKKIFRIITWAMLSIILQCSVLFYLDKVYFRHSSSFTTKVVENVDIDEDINIEIPSTVDENTISVSNNGRYISYYDNNKLMIANTKDSTIKEVLTNQNMDILFCKWVSYKNNILIGAEVVEGSIKLFVYNVRTDYKNDLVTLCSYSKNTTIDDIVSSRTGTHYVSVSKEGVNSTIYRVDINEDMSAVKYQIPEFGGMKVFQYSDTLIYKDSLNERLYSYTSDNGGSLNNLNLANMEKYELLYVDTNGNIYLGENKDEKIISILHGNKDNDPSTWQTITLDKEKNVKDIYVDAEGTIYINDNLSGKVTNMNTKDAISYDGKLIEITDNVICSINDGKIALKQITDVDKTKDSNK